MFEINKKFRDSHVAEPLNQVSKKQSRQRSLNHLSEFYAIHHTVHRYAVDDHKYIWFSDSGAENDNNKSKLQCHDCLLSTHSSVGYTQRKHKNQPCRSSHHQKQMPIRQPIPSDTLSMWRWWWLRDQILMARWRLSEMVVMMTMLMMMTMMRRKLQGTLAQWMKLHWSKAHCKLYIHKLSKNSTSSFQWLHVRIKIMNGKMNHM